MGIAKSFITRCMKIGAAFAILMFFERKVKQEPVAVQQPPKVGVGSA